MDEDGVVHQFHFGEWLETELCLRAVAQCLCRRHALRISRCNTVLLDQIGTFYKRFLEFSRRYVCLCNDIS